MKSTEVSKEQYNLLVIIKNKADSLLDDLYDAEYLMKGTELGDSISNAITKFVDGRSMLNKNIKIK